MFNTKIKQRISKIETTCDTINDSVKSIDEVYDFKINELKKENDALDERIVALEQHLENYLKYKTKKESDEVYFEVISETFDPENGIELKLDWNEAGINYLKRNGYHGDDSEIVEKYLYDLFKSAQQNKTYE